MARVDLFPTAHLLEQRKRVAALQMHGPAQDMDQAALGEQAEVAVGDAAGELAQRCLAVSVQPRVA